MAAQVSPVRAPRVPVHPAQIPREVPAAREEQDPPPGRVCVLPRRSAKDVQGESMSGVVPSRLQSQHAPRRPSPCVRCVWWQVSPGDDAAYPSRFMRLTLSASPPHLPPSLVTGPNGVKVFVEMDGPDAAGSSCSLFDGSAGFRLLGGSRKGLLGEPIERMLDDLDKRRYAQVMQASERLNAMLEDEAEPAARVAAPLDPSAGDLWVREWPT